MSAKKNSVLKRFLIFLGVLLALNFVLTRAYLGMMSISRLDRVDKLLFEEGDHIEYLILGDSHIQRGLNPLEFDNAFNFSSVGESYVQTYYKIATILRKNLKQVDAVLLPCDLHSFSAYRNDRMRDSYYWVKYIDYIELGRYKNDLSSYLIKWVKGTFVPYSDGGKKNIFDFITKGKSDEILKGHIAYEGDFSRKKAQDEIAAERAGFHLAGQDYTDPEMYHFFSKIIEVCTEHDVKVFLLKTPVTMEYYLQATKLVDENRIYRKAEAIYQGNPNVVVLDYQKVFFDRDEMFYDPDHLNGAGAREFSSMLNAKLASIKAAEENDTLVGK